MERTDGLAAEMLLTAEKYRMLEKGDRVLVALSGGADSTALAVLLAALAGRLGIEVLAAHLNHCLRGEESDRDERFVRELCGSLGIPLEAARENIAEAAKAEGAGIEETARNVRYGFLRSAAERFGCSKIATAHNANDNAETMLLNLARGAGLRGLCGIPPVRGNIIRPLLFSSRKDIEKFLDDRSIQYVTDRTNFDTQYTRNKIRHNVIPVFLEINPSFLKGAGDTAQLLRLDSDYLDEAASRVPLKENSPPSFGRRELLELPGALSGRVARRMYSEALKSRACETGRESPELSKDHADSVLKLAASPRPSGEIHLPNGVTAKISYGHITMSGGKAPAAPEEIPLGLGETRFGKWHIRAEKVTDGFEKNDEDAAYLDPELVGEILSVRGSRSGDDFSPAGRSWTKSLKKLYIEKKIPREERGSRPVVACGRGVCAVPGFGADKRFAAVRPPAIKITFAEGSGQE